MKLYIQQDVDGNVTRLYFMIKNSQVKETRELVRSGKTVVNVDVDKGNNFLGIEVTGLIKLIYSDQLPPESS